MLAASKLWSTWYGAHTDYLSADLVCMSISSLMSIWGSGGISAVLTLLTVSIYPWIFTPYKLLWIKKKNTWMLTESQTMSYRKRLKAKKNDFYILRFPSVGPLMDGYPAWLDSKRLLSHLWPFQRWLHHWCLKDTVPVSNKWLPLNESLKSCC